MTFSAEQRLQPVIHLGHGTLAHIVEEIGPHAMHPSRTPDLFMSARLVSPFLHSSLLQGTGEAKLDTSST